jgi:predicted NACHT family NTPase
MAKRSLQTSTSGAKKAKQQFISKGWTQEYLANEVGIKTRQPIWRFLRDKRSNVIPNHLGRATDYIFTLYN